MRYEIWVREIGSGEAWDKASTRETRSQANDFARIIRLPDVTGMNPKKYEAKVVDTGKYGK